MQQQQAMAAQRAMMPQRKPEDALLEALSQQALQGEMMKESANYKMKMLKLRMKYGSGQSQQGPAQRGPQGGM